MLCSLFIFKAIFCVCVLSMLTEEICRPPAIFGTMHSPYDGILEIEYFDRKFYAASFQLFILLIRSRDRTFLRRQAAATIFIHQARGQICICLLSARLDKHKRFCRKGSYSHKPK